MESREEMSVYYVGKPEDSQEARNPELPAVPAPAPGPSAVRPLARSRGTTRPYEVSSRIFSTAQTAVVLGVLVTCIAGAILILYKLDDRWRPDWKAVAYCDFDSLISNHCSSESIDRVSAIIQHDADTSFRRFTGDSNNTALHLASAYFRHCRDLYSESNDTYNRIVSSVYGRGLGTIDVIRFLSDQSPLFPVDVWRSGACEGGGCSLWKCDPATAHATLLGASTFSKRVAALNGSSLTEDHRQAIGEMYQTLLDSLLAACAHSNDSAFEQFEEDSRYALASASFNALKPFRQHRNKRILQWFVADLLIGLIRPRSLELARNYLGGGADVGEAECLDSTKRIFGNITYLPYVDQQMQRFAESMEQVMLGRYLVRFFGDGPSGNLSRLVLGLSDVRLAEIEQINSTSLSIPDRTASYAEFAAYEQTLDGLYGGNRRLSTAIVEKQATEDGKLVVPLILAKLLDIADTPVKDSMAQLLLRNAGHNLDFLDEQWALAEVAS